MNYGRGFGEFTFLQLRARLIVRPFLLGADRYYSSDSPDVESGSVHLISEQRKQDGEEKQQEAGLVPHREEEQVEKDTNRSFVLYPSGQLLRRPSNAVTDKQGYRKEIKLRCRRTCRVS
jgi:hypothetical protein